MSFNEQNSRENYGRKNGQQQQKPKAGSKPQETIQSQPESYEL